MKYFYKSLTSLLILMMFSMNWAMAQERTVSGRVISEEDNSPLPGVNVIVKGTSSGTVTDIDGNYSIGVAENSTLVFSFIGFATQEVVVGNRNTIDIILGSDVRALSEVVVIGYGTQQKRDATGAVASVKSEDFNIGVISSPEQLIQGKSAGVQITQASGEPGAGVNIRIRGTSSVRGGNNPLFVIDGIPLSGAEVSAGGADVGRGGSAARNPLNFLNPNDIESIDILKDASATAIYGARGANGVVLITTKSGRGRKNQVEYTANLSFAHQANKFDLLNRQQFLSGISNLGGEPLDFEHDTDWQDEISRTAVSHRHDVSYANNYKSGNYRASLSYDNQQGIIKNSELERITGRLNLNHAFLNDKLKFGGQLTLSRVNDQAAPITDAAGFQGDLLGAAYMTNPTMPADPDQQFQGDIANPLSMLKFIQDNTYTNRSLINLSLGYDITNDLNFSINTGFDNANSTREDAASGQLRNFGNVTNNGLANINEIENSSQLLEAVLNYQRNFDNSTLSALVGYSYQQFKRSGFRVSGWGFNNPNTIGFGNMISDLENASSAIQGVITEPYQQFGYDDNNFFITQLFPEVRDVALNNRPSSPVRAVAANTFEEEDELQSFFGRVNYSILDKYLFTGTLRADGSTRFGGNNKYGIFPSAAFAWRLSDEDFVPDFFDDLKLRLGYGVTGNQEIPHNLYQTRVRWNDVSINDGGNVNVPGTNNVAFQNPNLKWEQTTQWNLGLDYGFVRGRLNGSVDFYRKVTNDLLIQVRAAQPSPQPFIWRNLDADVINSGVEFTLNYIAIESENVGLDLNFNIAYNHNVIENFAGILNTGNISGQGLSGAYAQRIAEGQPLYAFFLREFDGYNSEGLAEYIGGDVQRFLGLSPIPKYNIGFSLNLRYMNWDLSAFLYGMTGHYVYNNTQNAFFTKGSLFNGRNVTQDVLESNESPANPPEVSTRFIEKGDFLRMQNLNIGYNFNLTGGFINALRINASGQNLFVLTGYSGLDPEVNINKARDGVPSLGIDYTSYPRPRTFTLGLTATF